MDNKVVREEQDDNDNVDDKNKSNTINNEIIEKVDQASNEGKSTDVKEVTVQDEIKSNSGTDCSGKNTIEGVDNKENDKIAKIDEVNGQIDGEEDGNKGEEVSGDKECKDKEDANQEGEGEEDDGSQEGEGEEDEGNQEGEGEEDDQEEEEEESEQKDEEISDNPYDRMVRSLTNRGTNKRKVKLMENQLAHFVFAESDSEDDEDYNVGDEEMPTDDDDDESDGQGKRKKDDESDDSSDDDGKGKQLNLLDMLRSYESHGGKDDDSESEKEEEVNEIKDEEMDDGEKDIEIDTDTEKTSGVQGVKKDDILRSNRLYKKDVLVCGVCLESDENEGDEIVECDNCGITVHEGCYGDFDLEFDNKSVSDDLTEPWFCEPCKSEDVYELICELCPTKGGVFKQTDTGKWVHLICALYTPHVGFRDVVKLQIVVLEDIKREMWGKKECAFCCDDTFSKTGVCICCDSGLCRTTFHVSCGQKNGFLSDIPDKNDKNDENGDFLFAHCKLHTMKAKLKKRKTSCLAFQARLSKFKHSDDPEEKIRINIALTQAKLEYKAFRRDMIPPKQLPQELPRLFSSCPEACIMLSRKAELLEKVEEPSYSISNAVVSGRIQKHEANLSEDFVRYFFNRETQMKELQVSVNQGEPNQLNLQNQQKALMNKSESYHFKLEEVQKLKNSLTKSCHDIHDMLCKLASKSLKLPNVLKPNENNEKIEQSTELLNSIIHRCDTCKSTDNQHLLAQCGTCSRYYHMDCVDPPLSRLPRKSDKYVWQCSLCDPSDKSESDTEGPICVLFKDENGVVRRKRPNKEPDKYNPEHPKDKKEKKEDTKDSDNKSAKEKVSTGKETDKEKKPSKRKSVVNDEETPKKRKYAKKEVQNTPDQPNENRGRGKEKNNENSRSASRDREKNTENSRSASRDKEKNNDNSRSASLDKVKVKEKETPTPKKKVVKQEKVTDCFVCKTIGDPKSLVKCDECSKCYHFLTCINPPYPRNPKVSKYWSWICEECDNSDDQSAIDPVEDKRVSNKPVAIGIKEEDSKSGKTQNIDKRRSVNKKELVDDSTVDKSIPKSCKDKSVDRGSESKNEEKAKSMMELKIDTSQNNRASEQNQKAAVIVSPSIYDTVKSRWKKDASKSIDKQSNSNDDKVKTELKSDVVKEKEKALNKISISDKNLQNVEKDRIKHVSRAELTDEKFTISQKDDKKYNSSTDKSSTKKEVVIADQCKVPIELVSFSSDKKSSIDGTKSISTTDKPHEKSKKTDSKSNSEKSYSELKSSASLSKSKDSKSSDDRHKSSSDISSKKIDSSKSSPCKEKEARHDKSSNKDKHSPQSKHKSDSSEVKSENITSSKEKDKSSPYKKSERRDQKLSSSKDEDKDMKSDKKDVVNVKSKDTEFDKEVFGEDY